MVLPGSENRVSRAKWARSSPWCPPRCLSGWPFTSGSDKSAALNAPNGSTSVGFASKLAFSLFSSAQLQLVVGNFRETRRAHQQREDERILHSDAQHALHGDHERSAQLVSPAHVLNSFRFVLDLWERSVFSAPQDIPRADEVKTLVKDIWDLRLAKLRSSMNEFIKSDSMHAKVG